MWIYGLVHDGLINFASDFQFEIILSRYKRFRNYHIFPPQMEENQRPPIWKRNYLNQSYKSYEWLYHGFAELRYPQFWGDCLKIVVSILLTSEITYN